MNIKVMPLGMVQANCYIVTNNQNEGAIIDPGGETERIVNYLEQNKITPKMILLTHGHFDHVASVWDLIEKYNLPVYINENDAEMLKNINISLCNMSTLYFNYKSGLEYNELKDEDIVRLGDLEFKLIHTPGHSKGSSCFIVENVIFTGDTLFCGDIGRTDLYGGDYATIKKSLKKLSELEKDYFVYPGHGPSSSIENEKATNPYMGQVDYDDYF